MKAFDYKTIFTNVEESLRLHFGLTINEFKEKYATLKALKFQQKSDQEYFDLLKMIVFYSGFNAATVTKKEATINKYFGDFSKVAIYGDAMIAKILSDQEMIKNRKKVNAVIKNARKFLEIVKKHGSFHKYLESFSPTASFENLMILKEELGCQFDFLSGVTGFHFLMDIGLNVIKPDRVITRIFKRLD